MIPGMKEWLEQEGNARARKHLLNAVKKHMGVEECTIGEMLAYCEKHKEETFDVETGENPYKENADAHD